jgi:hypothetical protein
MKWAPSTQNDNGAELAANVCGSKVGRVGLLAQQVDGSGEMATAWTTGHQAVRFIG